MTPDTVADMIGRYGQSVVLRRLTGTQQIAFDVSVTAIVRGYQPHELIGPIKQGDREVRISAREISARQWPGPPRVNDKVVIDLRAFNVEAVDTLKIGDDIAEHVIRIMG